jgi:hypothetical protein
MTDADRQLAVEVAARLCYLATLAVCVFVGPYPALGILLIVCGVSLALVEWAR